MGANDNRKRPLNKIVCKCEFEQKTCQCDCGITYSHVRFDGRPKLAKVQDEDQDLIDELLFENEEIKNEMATKDQNLENYKQKLSIMENQFNEKQIREKDEIAKMQETA